MSYHYPVRQYENSGTHIAISWVVAVLTGFYMLPWAIAATRHKENTGMIALLNVFLGWSGVGWIIALVLACLSDPVRQPIVAPPYHPGAGYQQPALGPSTAQFPSYQPPPSPFQGQQPVYQAPVPQQNPYYEAPRYPDASPYGQPLAIEAGPNTQHAFGMNSTDPFSTYPAVEQQVPTVEGHVDDGRRR